MGVFKGGGLQAASLMKGAKTMSESRVKAEALASAAGLPPVDGKADLAAMMKQQAIQQQQQLALFAAMNKVPAVFVNGFMILDAGGVIRIVFADQIAPVPGLQGEPRFIAAMRVPEARMMMENLQKVIDRIEEQAKASPPVAAGPMTTEETVIDPAEHLEALEEVGG